MPDAYPREFTANDRLAGKVAVVTGAASGIGLGVAHRFACEGAQVVAVDRAADRLAESAARLALDGEVLPVQADVTIADDISRMVEGALDKYGRIDVLINNAGAENPHGGLDLEEDEWDRQISVNLKSVYLVSRAVWPAMMRQGGGAIVNAASVNSSNGLHDVAAYCSAKAGVLMLTKCMAMEGGPTGIRVNCVAPGYTKTPNMDRFWEGQPEGAEDWVLAMTPLGRGASPAEIASAYLFLASDEAAFVTGASLLIDGGITAGWFAKDAANAQFAAQLA